MSMDERLDLFDEVAARDTPILTLAQGGWRSVMSSAAKRTLDLVVASFLLVLLAPLMLVIAAAVALTSRGPILFRQVRVGRGGRRFVIMKFRSMHRDSDDGLHRDHVTRLLSTNESCAQKVRRDPRITRVGTVLRCTSLDELPQLFNVIRGDMSIVGPRPALPWETDLYGRAFLVRLFVKPGMTGLWQVSGRGDVPLAEGLALDAEYVRRASLRLDVSIMLRTIPAVLTGRGAR